MATFAEWSRKQNGKAFFSLFADCTILQYEVNDILCPVGFASVKDAGIYLASNHSEANYHLLEMNEKEILTLWGYWIIVLEDVKPGDNIKDLFDQDGKPILED